MGTALRLKPCFHRADVNERAVSLKTQTSSPLPTHTHTHTHLSTSVTHALEMLSQLKLEMMDRLCTHARAHRHTHTLTHTTPEQDRKRETIGSAKVKKERLKDDKIQQRLKKKIKVTLK